MTATTSTGAGYMRPQDEPAESGGGYMAVPRAGR
jgi:hypothetical protein